MSRSVSKKCCRFVQAIGVCAIVACAGLGSFAQQSSSLPKNPITSLLGKPSSSTDTGQAPAATAPPAQRTAIPLPEVAAKAEDLSRLLREISLQLPSREQLDSVKDTLDTRDELFQTKEREVDSILAASPNALELREQETYWQALAGEGAATRRQLLEWATAEQAVVQQLQALEPRWVATMEENQNTADLGPTLDVIQNAVKSIQSARTQTLDLLRTVVNLQVTAANQHQLALDTLGRLTAARERLKGRILRRDSLPLWNVLLRRQQDEQSVSYFHNTSSRLVAIRSFVRENAGIFLTLAVVFVLCLFLAYQLYRATHGLQPGDEQQAQALATIRHWLALGLLPPLLLAFLLAPVAPLALVGLAIVLSFYSIIVLLPPLVGPQFRPLLFWLVAVYMFNATLAWLTLSPAARREIQFLGSTAAALLFAWLLSSKRISELREFRSGHRLFLFAARLAVAVLALGQIANLFGYYGLSQYLTVLATYSTFVALAIYTALRVFILLLLAGLAVPAAERFAMVRLHRAALERWVPRIMQWVGALLWVGAVLGLTGTRTPVNQFIADILSFNIAGAASYVTLGSVLAFWAILLGGFALSSAVRFLLREELLKRMHLKRGIPELLSTTLHYLLLLLVFLFAVNAGGVALNKFTVLTGALGVGVGFGLQNIVNNFVSGLILQFERPIRMGDVVELEAGTTGTVTRIGIRSSTVQTFQGAEVIVPNASFVSGNVTNWTLSEARRRLELPVGVAYGTDPRLVKQLLERPAVQHADVLTSPEPEAFFMGFGESAINFELRFWVMQESNTVKVKSEVALEVMRLLADAGVEIPFPQRDLRVRSLSPEAAASLLLQTEMPREMDPDSREPSKAPSGAER